MKTLIQNLALNQQLYRHPLTEIAWIEDKSTSQIHNCHPNVHATGSVLGMIKLCYWQKSDRIIRSNNYFYNTSKIVFSDDLDLLASKHCLCYSCLLYKAKRLALPVRGAQSLL